jgi:hypothetical protein
MRYKLGHVLMISRRKEIKRLGKWVSQLSSARAKVGNDVEQKDIFYAMQNAVDCCSWSVVSKTFLTTVSRPDRQRSRL